MAYAHVVLVSLYTNVRLCGLFAGTFRTPSWQVGIDS